MASRDRTHIARLLLEHFPEMADATSEEWHAFLNQATGLAVPLDEPNGSAFDKWRQALAAKDFAVWHTTPAKAAQLQARGAELVDQAAAFREDQAARTARETARLGALAAAEAADREKRRKALEKAR